MSIKLKKTEGLVIIGPQGSGKTSLALEIGVRYGDTHEIQAADLESSVRLGRSLCHEPACLVVDGAPTASGMEILKGLLASDEVICNRKYQDPVAVHAPHIIVTVDSDAFGSMPMHEDNRRWRVVFVQKIEEPAHASH